VTKRRKCQRGWRGSVDCSITGFTGEYRGHEVPGEGQRSKGKELPTEKTRKTRKNLREGKRSWISWRGSSEKRQKKISILKIYRLKNQGKKKYY